MLKEALLVLEQLSPRLCRLLAQLWDLTSLNVFVLLRLSQSLLAENDQLYVRMEHLRQFHEDQEEHEKKRNLRYEQELDALRHNVQELRAELQQMRQKAGRLTVENAQLRLSLSGIEDLRTGAGGGQDVSGVSSRDIENDITIVGDTEEREFFGVNSDRIEHIDKVHPVVSHAQDFDMLVQTLVERDQESMKVLNELDRFMNSNTVTLLWGYGSNEEKIQMMHKMMRATNMSTQTDPLELHDGLDDDEDGNDDERGDDAEGKADDLTACGDTGHAIIVTQCRVIPPTLRAQLSTRPKIDRVLEKAQLNRVILRLYLEKLEDDAGQLRSRQPRMGLHRFMKEFFQRCYEIAPLADYHMMEVVKSCLYYHEKHETARRKHKALHGMIGIPTTTVFDVVKVTANADSNGSSHPPPIFSAADTRVALFSRLCELIPMDDGSDTPSPAMGDNLWACALNTMIDIMGDVIELDPSVKSLEDVASLTRGDLWQCSYEVAITLLAQHLSFIDQKTLEKVKNQLLTVCNNSRPASTAMAAATNMNRRLSVDIFLSVVVKVWLDYDMRLMKKLREAFRKELQSTASVLPRSTKTITAGDELIDVEGTDNSSSNLPIARTFSVVSTTLEPCVEPPMKIMERIWTALPDESLSLLDVNELKKTFRDILKSKHPTPIANSVCTSEDVPKKKLSVVKVPATNMCVGGICEKEFVFHVLQILRARRSSCFGVRTNGRSPAGHNIITLKPGCGQQRPLTE